MSDRPKEINLNAIADRYYAEGDGTRKSASYFRAYERLLEGRRETSLRILELGVSSGASLLIWRDYLPNATIIGIDIGAKPGSLVDQDRVHFVQGSQDDPAVLDRAAQLAGDAFDLIVDDASHIGFLTKRSFNYLFPRWLVPGGCYVIEDIGTGFLPEYPDGARYGAPRWDDAVPDTKEFLSHHHGMIGVVKQLIDHMMQELITNARSHLPIERIVFETNITFVHKSWEPGAPLPDPLPARCLDTTVDGSTEETAKLSARLEALNYQLTTQNECLKEQLANHTDEMARHDKRVGDLEEVLGRFLGRFEPFRRLWRLVTFSTKPGDQR